MVLAAFKQSFAGEMSYVLVPQIAYLLYHIASKTDNHRNDPLEV